MSQITRGPRPTEDVAVGYGVELYNRVRCKHGWHPDALSVFNQEYARFAGMAIVGQFDVVSMWEYGWLVEATHQYLRYRDSEELYLSFHKKACTELEGIGTQLNKLVFDDAERASMRVAYDRMALIIKMWETPEARE